MGILRQPIFLSLEKHGSTTLRTQILLNAHSRFLKTRCGRFPSSRESNFHVYIVRRPLVPICRLLFMNPLR
jgi:hypothetical protein